MPEPTPFSPAPSSVEVPNVAAPSVGTGSGADKLRKPRGRRVAALLLLLVLLAAGVWGVNQWRVGAPVAGALGADSRNDGFHLTAHYRYYVAPNTLVLDLRSVDSASPLDLFRGLFEAADTLARLERPFARVILSRKGTPVFELDGEDFLSLGREYGGGENSLYLLRTLPEKLRRPDSGTHPYGTWEGGILGVAMRQMQDVRDAAEHWIVGGRAP